jgi:predicted metalloprotease with PDZ domain
LERIVARRADHDFSDFFKRHVRNVELLPYDEAFGHVGLRLVKTQSKEPFDAGLWLEIADRKATISVVVSNSPAEDAGLQAKDQIVSLAGKNVGEDWQKTLARFKPGDSVPVTVKRDRRTINTNLVLRQPERFDYKIEERPDATTEQKALRAAWLSGK